MSDNGTQHGSSEDLTLLGVSRFDYPTNPDDCDLQTIPWEQPTEDCGNGTTVVLDCPEFTAVCPKTSQPDFGHWTIRYRPHKLLIESKALKLYLFSFRNTGHFHETVIQRICRDLFEALNPHWIQVEGKFLPRGGISIHPTCYLEQDIDA